MTDAERLVTEGEELLDDGDDAAALARFRAAWAALTAPERSSDLGVRVFAATADACFFTDDWDGCCGAVQAAFRHGADVGNPFLRLRLGQALYELGNEREAANWLVPVYLMEGRAPFANDDPKYLEFFRPDSTRRPAVGRMGGSRHTLKSAARSALSTMNR